MRGAKQLNGYRIGSAAGKRRSGGNKATVETWLACDTCDLKAGRNDRRRCRTFSAMEEGE